MKSENQSAEGTLGEGENIRMARTVYERNDCFGDSQTLFLWVFHVSDLLRGIFELRFYLINFIG